jgi:hypothetical protein
MVGGNTDQLCKKNLSLPRKNFNMTERIMKKLSVLFIALVASATVAGAQDWGFGVRLGSGFQAVGQRSYSSGNYLEGRLGMGWLHHGVTADFSLLHVWNVENMDWTDEGRWFFDLGAGANLGGASHFFYGGIQGMARLGYRFDHAPVSLSLDWSPSFGPAVVHHHHFDDEHHDLHIDTHSVASFNTRGMANFGLSCVFRF